MASTFLNISTDTTLGGSNAADDVVVSQKAVKAYADTKQDALTAGTGISISNNTISITDPTLVNTANHAESLTIWGDSSSRRNTINIGKHSAATGSDSVMIGAYSSASEGAFAIGNGATAKNYGLALLGKTSVNYAYQIGRGTNSETYSLYVGWGDNTNFKLLDNTGIIPNARLNIDTTPTSASTNTITSGAVYTALSGKQDTSNLVTSVSSSSTDSQYPSAKLFYDTVGDIETLINAL